MGVILAIDLGKYKSVACRYEDGEFAFHSFITSREALDRLLAEWPADVVAVEACAVAGWVYDHCVSKGVNCLVANTAAEAWKFKHTKRKTDKDDALRLAQLTALGELPTVTTPPPAVRQKRSLIAYRQTLVGRRVAMQNRLRALLVVQGLAAPRGAAAWSAAGLAAFDALAKPLEACGPEELWRGQVHLLLADYRQILERIAVVEAKLDALAKADQDVQVVKSIPGVGARTAEAICAYLGDAKRFKSGKQVSAYGGFVPRQYQSGEMDRRGRISKRGPALLRKLLVQCAWAMLRYNAWAQSVYLRLTHGKRPRKKQAIVALARKLLVRAWAMLRDGKRWREPAAETNVAAAAAAG